MRKRGTVSKSLDKKHFTTTAAKTKKVNLPSTNFRGGIRF
nr:hypothetical protein JQQKEAMO_JQQKEAMO_CDS_0004 [Microvirus sp.]